MQIKDGVIMAGLNLKMRHALKVAESIYKSVGRSEGVTVTSALDGTHSAGSLHYYGYAFDIRTHYFDEDTKHLVYYELVASLGSDYDVILHPSHIHIEYNLQE